MSQYVRKPKVKEWDAVCLVLDVGASSSKTDFFQSMKKCCSELIQRKLYSKASDRFAVVLFGTKGSKNSLNYGNVMVPELTQSCLIEANFELLRFIELELSTKKSDVSGDWLDGVVVALDILKNCSESQPGVKEKKIVLMSDLGCEAKEDHLQTIAKSMQRENVEFSFIGPDFKVEDQEEDANESIVNGAKIQPTSIQSISLPMLNFLIESSSGIMINIEHAILVFTQKERSKKNPFPWKVDLEIGADIRIPVVGYIRVRRETPQTWKNCLSNASTDADEEWNLKQDVTFVKNDEDLTVVEPTDLIESFKYGSELVPIPNDYSSGIYNGGPKSLKLIGFIKQTEIPIHLALGDGSMVFQPEEGNDSSVRALSGLVNAMHEQQMAALVRKVYRAKTTPRLGVLVPSLMRLPYSDVENLILVFVEMPYMEDIRSFHFAPLSNDLVRPSEEQLAAVDNLIKALKIDDPSVLQTEAIMNPYYQHLFNCLTDRVMNPDQSMPEVSEHVKKIMDQPDYLKTSALEPLQKISELFPLEEVLLRPEKTTGEKFFVGKNMSTLEGSSADQQLNVEDLNLTTEGRVTTVGTTNPVEDFNTLIRSGYQMAAVASQIERVILSLMHTSFGEDFSEKIVTCLATYRESCINHMKFELYNTFIRDLKIEILTASKLGDKFWNLLCAQDLLLITKAEDPSSDVTDLESTEFGKIHNTVSQDSGHETPTSQEDGDDLLDDL